MANSDDRLSANLVLPWHITLSYYIIAQTVTLEIYFHLMGSPLSPSFDVLVFAKIIPSLYTALTYLWNNLQTLAAISSIISLVYSVYQGNKASQPGESIFIFRQNRNLKLSISVVVFIISISVLIFLALQPVIGLVLPSLLDGTPTPGPENGRGDPLTSTPEPTPTQSPTPEPTPTQNQSSPGANRPEPFMDRVSDLLISILGNILSSLPIALILLLAFWYVRRYLPRPALVAAVEFTEGEYVQLTFENVGYGYIKDINVKCTLLIGDENTTIFQHQYSEPYLTESEKFHILLPEIAKSEDGLYIEESNSFYDIGDIRIRLTFTYTDYAGNPQDGVREYDLNDIRHQDQIHSRRR